MSRERRQQVLEIRNSAAEFADKRLHPRHRANDDEQKFRRSIDGKNFCSYLANFTKGLPHNHGSGLVESPEEFQKFVKGIDSGDPADFIATKLGPKRADYSVPPIKGDWKSTKAKELPGGPREGEHAQVRAWESQGAGNTFDLQGPDAQAVTIPPAPALGSAELTAEMAEVYAQALLRDVPFTKIIDGTGEVKFTAAGAAQSTAQNIFKNLNALDWFKSTDCCGLTPAELSRKRQLNLQTLFRGITRGDDVGPYVSQFLLAGTGSINGVDDEGRTPTDGYVSYGAISIDQRVRYAKPYDDHMTTWNEWFDVQNGADLRNLEQYDEISGNKRRFITTPRDLATYVHYDALYEAYLNACLILLGNGISFDPGIPFQQSDHLDHQQGFAHFGGPHILSLVTEVATRALKAVRFQKFNIHRRMRPEVLAARLAKRQHSDVGSPEIEAMLESGGMKRILRLIAKKNGNDPDGNLPNNRNYLLPMAFCEGSPMHPSYGAGHATVAGACVTILKAFFDHKHPLAIANPKSAGEAFIPDSDGLNLIAIPVVDRNGDPGTLTVEGELNKLASNISIARDWAGVHYFTDYIESLRMGEQIAIGILEEQKLTYGENFSMTVPLFDGGSIRI